MSFTSVTLVAIGGALGSVLRYVISVGMQQRIPTSTFPWWTLLINLVGCFCIGLFSGVASKHSLPDESRLAVVTGFLGGFTTFSAFAFESLEMMATKPTVSLAYATGSTVLGIGLAWCGYWLGSRLS